VIPAWRVEFSRRAERQLRKIAEREQVRVLRFLEERIGVAEDPRRLGEALKGWASNLWRYRVGDFRIIVKIEDQRITILVLEVGHRREINR
jgi:mRNA interferase RelE/StbE